MRKRWIMVLTLSLGGLAAVAVAQTPEEILAASSGVGVATTGSSHRVPNVPTGAWELTSQTIRSTCTTGSPEAAYTGTISRNGNALTLETPSSPNWKRFRGEVVGNRLLLTAYQDPAVVRERIHVTQQIGVFHIVLSETVNGTLEGYGFRSTYAMAANGRPAGICDESVSVRLRKL